MITDLDPVRLVARIKRLPAKMRHKLEKWLADDELRQSLTVRVTRAARRLGDVQPTPQQGAVLAKLALYEMDWIGRERPLTSCINRGWARRKGDGVVITRAGRAWLDALLVRPNKKTVISTAIRPRRKRHVPKIENVDADRVAGVRNRDAQPGRSETKSQESTDAL